MKKKISALLLVCLFQFSCSLVHVPVIPKREIKKPGVFRGAYHVHSNFSHDSRAPLQLILDSAEKADLDFVLVTDHNNLDAVGAYEKMVKPKEPILVFADEISTWKDGHLMALGIHEHVERSENTQKNIDDIHKQNGYAIFAHPLSKRKPWNNWDLKDYDGMEVFCFSDYFYKQGPRLILKAVLLPPKSFIDSTITTPPGFKLWDDELQKTGRKIAGIGSADAHLKYKIGPFFFENFGLYLQTVNMYVLSDELDAQKITDSVGKGKSFIAFEVRGLAQDFSFTAEKDGARYQMGDSVINGPAQLKVTAPKPANIRLIHEGKVIGETNGTELNFEAHEAGYYRVEVYLNGKIWIFSNPIYLKSPETQDFSS